MKKKITIFLMTVMMFLMNFAFASPLEAMIRDEMNKTEVSSSANPFLSSSAGAPISSTIQPARANPASLAKSVFFVIMTLFVCAVPVAVIVVILVTKKNKNK